MTAAQQSLDSFLKHETRHSDFAKHLRGWKKRQPPAVNTFLHTRAPIVALWQHNFPRIVVREDEHKNTRVEVWGGNVNCMESEDVLKRQYNRGPDDERDYYPMVCPMCRLIETVRGMVRDGELSITAPVFVYEGDDPNKTRTITAGGIYNAFSDEDKLRSTELKAMRAAGISPREAWKENAYAKCNYVFSIVDADDVAAGVQVAVETTLLGDKVKELINAELMGSGDEDGNPLLKPYCIRWEHRPGEKEFGKRYAAIAMRKVQPTPDILALIRDEEPPNIDRIIEPPNVATLRATLEKHAQVELPWDDIFGPAEAMAGASGEPEPEGENVDDGTAPETKALDLDKSKPAPSQAKKGNDWVSGDDDDGPEDAPQKGGEQAQATGDDDVEIVTCDECGAEMKLTEFTCPGCGVEYDEDGNIVKRPPKKKRSRKAAAKKSKGAKAKDAKDGIPF